MDRQQPPWTAEDLRERLSQASLVITAMLSTGQQLREIVAEVRTTCARCRTECPVGEQAGRRLLKATARVNRLLRDPTGRLNTENVDGLIADWRFLLDQARIMLEQYRDVLQTTSSTRGKLYRVRCAYQRFLALMLIAKDERSTLAEVCRLRKELDDLCTEASSSPAVQAVISSYRTKLELRRQLSKPGAPERA